MQFGKRQLCSMLIFVTLVAITIGSLTIHNRQRKLSDYVVLPKKNIESSVVMPSTKYGELTKEDVYLLWDELKEIKVRYRYENAKNPIKTQGSYQFIVYFSDGSHIFISEILCIHVPIKASHKYRMNSEELLKFQNILTKYAS